jgi:predicted DCC family thiol-disulfide oxidoreductase YuxK
MSAYLFIAIFIVVIFAGDAAYRWWRQNQWKWRSRDDDDDGPATS